SPAADAQSDGGLRRSGKTDGDQLHWRVLRNGRLPHSGNGPCPGKTPGRHPPMESRWREAYVGVRVLRTQPVRNSQEGVTILPEAHVAIRNLYGLPPPRTARVVIPFNEVTWHSHLSSTVRSTCLCDLPH